MSDEPTMIVEDDEAERVALEAAVAEARADTRPSVPHAIVRELLRQDAEKARQRIAELANRYRHAG